VRSDIHMSGKVSEQQWSFHIQNIW